MLLDKSWFPIHVAHQIMDGIVVVHLPDIIREGNQVSAGANPLSNNINVAYYYSFI